METKEFEETTNRETIETTGVKNPELSEIGKRHLQSAAGWGTFLSILGFLGVAILLLIGIALIIITPFISEFSDFEELSEFFTLPLGMPFVWIGVFYILLAVLYFMPSFFLFKFASKGRKAIQNSNQQNFDETITYLKRTLKFFGILTLISLIISIIIIPIITVGSALAGRF